jgi:predicted PurR-regulated permease PerM
MDGGGDPVEPFYRRKAFTILIYSLLTLVILYMLMQIRPMLIWLYGILSAVLAPFVVAMIISYVLNPIVSLLNKRKVPRTVAVLLIYAVFITSAVVILMHMIPMFVKQMTELNEHLPELVGRAQALINQLNENRYFPDSVRTGINKALLKMESGVSSAVTDYIRGIGSTLNMVFVAFIIPFLAFYMLKDFKAIERAVVSNVPKRQRKLAVRLLIDIDMALGNYIRGQFLVCMIVGVLAYIGYWIAGMNYPLLLACMVAIFNIIPYLGPFFGAAPAILMAATVSWKMVVYVIIVNMVVQNLESNIISPQVVGRTLHMHPLTIIFVLLVGGELAGVMGLILAVPFFAVLKVFSQHIRMYYLQRKPPPTSGGN